MSRPWYIVLEAWHPFLHLGLDGIPWPLADDHGMTGRLEAALEPLPYAPGGCLFNVCFDLGVVRDYFLAAGAHVGRSYLIEVNLVGRGARRDGFDVGRPDGGFSVAGQEACKSAETHRRFGRLLNVYGLFPTEQDMRSYLDDRAVRVATEGLEHLDESVPVEVCILETKGV